MTESNISYRAWVTPCILGLLTWGTSAIVLFFITPQYLTIFSALLPLTMKAELVLRSIMTVAVMFGTWQFERAMQKIKDLEQRLYLSEYSVEHTKAFAMLWADENGEIIKINQHAAENLGYTKEELLSYTIFQVYPDHDIIRWEKFLELLKEKRTIVYKTRQQSKTGERTLCVVYSQYLKAYGNHYHFAFVYEPLHTPDVTTQELQLPSIEELTATSS